MSSIKAHFDGKAVVLDEPATLTVGQQVRVVIDSSELNETDAPPDSTPSKREFGAWKGKLRILDDGDDVILDHFKECLP